MAPTHPQTYKVAIFNKANDTLSIEDREWTEPKEGEIVIKVLANGLCHSDVMVQAGDFGISL